MKRIYLSGPMTGLPGLNFAAFHAMTTNLRAGGHTLTKRVNNNHGRCSRPFSHLPLGRHNVSWCRVIRV